MARSRLLTGAQTLVYINGQLFGRIADISWSSETPQSEKKVVDWMPPWELVPQGASVRGVMTIYRIHKDGGIEGAGMTANWNDLTRQKYFSVMVLDRVTDTVLFQADKCSVTGQSWRIGRGYVMGNINFTGLYWNNETSPSAE